MLIRIFKKFQRKTKGSLTVEATLVLPLVIITLLFVTNLLNIYMVHTCMQQAINNTAKKISQNSYLIYRFAGENNYKEFINFLDKANEGYEEFENQATATKNSFGELQESIKTTLRSYEETTHTFDDFDFSISNIVEKCNEFTNNICDTLDNFENTIDKTSDFANSISELATKGKNNIKSIVIKLLCDTSSGIVTTSIVNHIFNSYTSELNVPASKISNLNSFHSSLNDDGSFTLVVSYLYINPFSFINKKSLEYSTINKTIRLINVITVKPFVGKNETSIKGKFKVDESKDDNEIMVWIPDSSWNIDGSDKRYHNKPKCGNTKSSYQVTLSQAESSSYISGPCKNCFPNGRPTK